MTVTTPTCWDSEMARMPKVEWLGEHSPGRFMERYDIVCVHTIVGHAPAHQAHFSTWKSGKIGQSRDTKFRSAANLNGNHRVIAIENEDAAQDVPLSAAQVEACAQILAWAHKTHGVPLQLCPNSRPGSRGLAYHRQGVDGNFGVAGARFPGRVQGGELWSESRGKICPRDKRIEQLPAILKRAKEIVNVPPAKPAVTRGTDVDTAIRALTEEIAGKNFKPLSARGLRVRRARWNLIQIKPLN